MGNPSLSMNNKSLLKPLVVSLFIIIIFSFVGCGNSGNTGGGPSPTPTPTSGGSTPTVTPTPTPGGPPEKYTLNISISSGGTVNLSPLPDSDGKYNAGTIVKMTPIASAGYFFKEWQGSNWTEVTYQDAITMNGTKNVTASFLLGGQDKIIIGEYIGSGQYNTYIMNVDGSNKRLLNSLTKYPIFSPNRSKLAFLNGHTIIIANADGSGQITVTGQGADALFSWSPDGNKILFNYGFNFYTVNSDGSNVLQLTNSVWTRKEPAWSPDSNKIVYYGVNTGSTDSINVMNPDGTINNRTIIENISSLSQNSNFYWFDDNNRITISCSNILYLIDITSCTINQVSNNPNNYTYTRNTAISPDGTKIIYQSRRNNKWGLYLMDLISTNETLLFSSDSNSEYNPYINDCAWSTDGNQVIICAGSSENIYIVNSDGSHLRKLTNNSIDCYYIFWKP